MFFKLWAKVIKYAELIVLRNFYHLFHQKRGKRNRILTGIFKIPKYQPKIFVAKLLHLKFIKNIIFAISLLLTFLNPISDLM